MITGTDDDEILENLIDTFPASDPTAWVALARVGIPKRKPAGLENHHISDRTSITCSP
jgi:hypothetical protein